MKNVIKKFITLFICCTLFGISISFNISVEAKVIEPKIVKTESWTTSYFIDDDIETLYPYIQCEADIYSDGTIKLYMWNAHEWDGFATVQHDIELYNTEPLDWLDTFAQLMMNGYTIDQSGGRVELTETEIHNRMFSDRVSTFPHTYRETSYNTFDTELVYGFGYIDRRFCYKEINVITNRNGYWNDSVHYAHCFLMYKKSLPNVGVFSNRQEIGYEFNPTKETDLTKPQQFRLFGHDVTITPEMLSGDVVSTPVKTENDLLIEQIEQLKTENEKLKKDIESLTNKVADVNNDGIITIEDALTTLQYYTRNTLLGENTSWEEILNKS